MWKEAHWLWIKNNLDWEPAYLVFTDESTFYEGQLKIEDGMLQTKAIIFLLEIKHKNRCTGVGTKISTNFFENIDKFF